MIKFLRKMYIGFLSIFDRKFVARALNIHHPSEDYAWNAYYNRMRKDYEEYEEIRMELSEWHWLMRKFGCQTIQEFEQVIEDLCVKPNKELDELKAAVELTGRELGKWNALARNFGCFSQSELYMMVESMKNQVDFLCKSRKPADPQYVDEWFRFKKMF